MKKHGHYCKVCGEYKANEKFSGKGHAAHICKSCASLSPEKQAEQMTVNHLLNLPWRLSKEQISWLKNRMKDKHPEVRALAKEQYEMRFPPKQLEDTDDDFDFLDEDDFIEYRKRSAPCRPFLFWKGGSIYGNHTHHAPAYRKGAH